VSLRHPLRFLTRVLLAGMFVYGGLDALREPGRRAKRAAVVTEPLMQAVGIEADPQLLVSVNAGVQVTAGVLLALGRLPRLAATALAGSLVLTTAAGHRFWEASDAESRAQQTTQFLKNAAMLGGLLEIATSS
jgi:uncharacterized membrane protein YphA (DoxX/SURF4 family)